MHTCTMDTAVFFNLFAAAEPSANVCVARGTLCNDPSVYIATTAKNCGCKFPPRQIWSVSAEPLAANRRTLGFLGTLVEKHWHTVIQSRIQTISMIGSCWESQWNMQSKSTTARSAADHQCEAIRTISLHPPPPKIKSNRRFNALAKEVQNTIDSKHKKLPTHYKDPMRPKQAIRSNTEHICTTMFTRRRRLSKGSSPFVARRWPPHTASIPGCFIRPQMHINTWKLE